MNTLSTLAVVLPSRETIYAIAASQMDEQALKSDIGAKTFRALDAWLDRQIAPAQRAE